MQRIEIRIEGHLDPDWLAWLGDYHLQHTGGQTLLTGQIKDQSELYGLIAKMRDLGVRLVSINLRNQENRV